MVTIYFSLVERQYQMFEIQQKIHIYALNQVRFQVNNLQQIEEELDDDTVEEFASFSNAFDLSKYIKIHVEGTRRFLLGESVVDIPKAQKQLQILKVIDVTFRVALIAIPLFVLIWLTIHNVKVNY